MVYHFVDCQASYIKSCTYDIMTNHYDKTLCVISTYFACSQIHSENSTHMNSVILLF